MLARLFRYGLVGLTGVGVNVVVLTIARQMWPHELTFTYVLAVELSIVWNYFWNARITFNSRPHWKEGLRYNIVSWGGGLLQTLVYRMLLGVGWPYLLADIVAIPVGTLVGFVLSNVWVFRLKRGDSDGSNPTHTTTDCTPQRHTRGHC